MKGVAASEDIVGAVSGLAVIGAGGYLAWQFFQCGVPDGSPFSATMNRFSLRFWLAVWCTFYRLDPHEAAAIVAHESNGDPQYYAMAEPNGTTSWGPFHLNDGGTMQAVGVSDGNSIADDMHGTKAGCQLLRSYLDQGLDYPSAIQKWNPGQGDYYSSVQTGAAKYGWAV